MLTVVRNALTISAGCVFLLAASSAWAQQSCQTDADCPTGQTCDRAPCVMPVCDPDDDPNCSPMPCISEGVCEESDSCTADAECPTGFACQEVGGSDCVSAPCPAGETCPDPLPCQSERLFACVPGPCSESTDCGEGLVCVTFSKTLCQASSSSCAPGETCTEPAPEASCEEIPASFCAPPYIAPCAEDSDCGEGFVCKPEQLCSCSGGGALPVDPSAPDDGGTDESECSCEATGENYCEAEQRPCETMAECPDGWSCDSSVNVAVPCTFDPQTGVSECLPPEVSESYCVPPQWDVWGTSSGSYDNAVDRAQSGTAPTAPSTVQESGGCAIMAAADQAATGAMLLLLGLACVLRRRRSSPSQ
ncbi:MAG: hypothetical protein JRH20_13620 [Deltaproteobacteria bacterium]|nr:hypothetical protein [Deltaproteobacteria bacterium]